MTEPITLTVVGTIALTEGIKFLYTQAGEVLKRWQERRSDQENAAQVDQAVPIEIKLPDVFVGQLSAPKIHFDAVAQLEGQLRDIRKDLADYAEEIEQVDTQDMELLTKVDALRQAMEAIFQQHITFHGEQRSISGPVVTGRIDVKQVAGYVAAVRTRKINSGNVAAEAKAERVESGGQLIGIDVDAIGGNGP